MINTSKAYKEAIAGDAGNREFCVADKITFSDGTQVTLSLEDLLAYSINDATSESGKFQVGAAIIKEYSITLNNFEGKFDGYNFESANVTADVGLKMADGSCEILRKGTFRIVQAKENEQTINVTAYDGMLFFDRPYSESQLSYPATVTEIIADACTCCQMTFDASTVVMGDYVVQERPADDALTFRDIISFCAQIMGCYARIDRLDKLQFGWYSFENDVNIWGGIFDGDTPYSTGSDLDGGTFNPWNTGDIYSDGFETMEEYHHLYDLKTKSINTDDIVITGVQVYAHSEGSSEVPVSSYGEDGYVVVIENNPLIQSTADAQTVAQHVGGKLTYSCFRPMSITVRSDPSIEAGDTAIVTISALKPSIHTVITNTTFSIGGAQKIECSAETPTEKTYTKYSAQTRIIAKMNRETDVKLNAYEVAVQQMNQLAANTMGFFATSVKQADGSILAYRHDKPELSESSVVYKSGIDGFWVTEDYRGTDDATTAAGKWRAGLDSNGNAVLNMLSVVGINFNWAKGGTLTLGGADNGNGLLRILDANGNQIGYIDKDGVHFEKGEFKGVMKAGKVESSNIDGSVVSGTKVWSFSRLPDDILWEIYQPRADDNPELWGRQEYIDTETDAERTQRIAKEEQVGDGMVMDSGGIDFYYSGPFSRLYPDYTAGIVGSDAGQKCVMLEGAILVDDSYYSDERLKDIDTWDGDKYDELLMALTPIQFHWKDKKRGTETHTGFGARTVKGLMEGLGIAPGGIVFGSEKTSYRMNYQEFHAIEIASIQKSRRLIEQLEKRIEQLEKQLKKEGK